MKRIFRSKGFYFAVFLQCIGYLYYFIQFRSLLLTPHLLFAGTEVLHAFTMGREHGIVLVLLPLIAVLPAAGMVAEDRQSGFVKMILHRTSRGKYAASLLGRAAAGAVLASLLGSVCFIALLAACTDPPGERTAQVYAMLQRSSYAAIADPYGVRYMLDSVLRTAAAALSWSLAGVGICALCGNAGLGLVLTTALCFQLSTALFYRGDVLMHWSQQSLLSVWISYAPGLWPMTLRQGVYLLGGLLMGAGGLWWALRREQGVNA